MLRTRSPKAVLTSTGLESAESALHLEVSPSPNLQVNFGFLELLAKTPYCAKIFFSCFFFYCISSHISSCFFMFLDVYIHTFIAHWAAAWLWAPPAKHLAPVPAREAAHVVNHTATCRASEERLVWFLVTSHRTIWNSNTFQHLSILRYV